MHVIDAGKHFTPVNPMSGSPTQSPQLFGSVIVLNVLSTPEGSPANAPEQSSSTWLHVSNCGNTAPWQDVTPPTHISEPATQIPMPSLATGPQGPLEAIPSSIA